MIKITNSKFSKLDKNNFILLTGAAGYIGSNLSHQLISLNYKIVLIDNFSTGKKLVIKKLLKKKPKNVFFEEIDLTKKLSLKKLFKKYKINLVIHLASFKEISESIKFPKKYIKNNYQGTLNLINEMEKNQINKFIYSSTAAVYKSSKKKVNEKSKIKITNPYAKSKLLVERYLDKLHKKNKLWSIVCLRYFNPLGTNSNSEYGEYNFHKMNNLISEISKVYLGWNKNLIINGNNFMTNDGTCIRDFIDIRDLCSGHIKAINFINKKKVFKIINLGSGKGTTVLNLVKIFNIISKNKIKYYYGKNRKGDIEISLANIKLAKKLLKWKPIYKLKESCINQINWLKKYYVN